MSPAQFVQAVARTTSTRKVKNIIQPTVEAKTPEAAAIHQAVYVASNVSKHNLPSNVTDVAAKFADSAVTNKDPAASLALRAMTVGVEHVHRSAQSPVVRVKPTPEAYGKVVSAIGTELTSDLTPAIAGHSMASDFFGVGTHNASVPDPILPSAVPVAVDNLHAQGHSNAAKVVSDAYLSTDTPIVTQSDLTDEKSAAVYALMDATLSGSVDTTSSAERLQEKSSVPPPEYVPYAPSVKQPKGKSKPVSTLEAHLPPEALDSLSKLGSHVVNTADSLLRRTQPQTEKPAGQTATRDLVRDVKGDPLLKNTIDYISKRQGSGDHTLPTALIDARTPATKDAGIASVHGLVTSALTKAGVNPVITSQIADRLVHGKLAGYLKSGDGAQGFTAPLKHMMANIATDAATTVGEQDSSVDVASELNKIKDVHLPNVVSVLNPDDPTLKSTVYHELMHSGMSPAGRKAALQYMHRAAKSTNPEIRKLFANAVTRASMSGTGAPVSNGKVEEAVAYMLSSAADKATSQGVTLDHYLNKGAGKSIKHFISHIILPKVRAYGLRKNMKLKTSAGLNLQTFAELARYAGVDST